MASLTCLAAQVQVSQEQRADFSKAKTAVEMASQELKAGWDVVNGAEQRREKLSDRQKHVCRERIDTATERLGEAKHLIRPISPDLAEVKWLNDRIGYREEDRDKLAKRIENEANPAETSLAAGRAFD